MKRLTLFVLLLNVAIPALIAQPAKRFETIVLSEEFHSEGAAIADIDADGHADLVSGPFWYQGPDFRRRHAYAEVKSYSIKGYSDHFFAFTDDYDADGRADILTVPIPGSAAVWYRNPGTKDGEWQKFQALAGVGNESPLMADIDSDGRNELICIQDGQYGYAQPGHDPTQPWDFTPITPNRNYGRFTHGLGVGDVDGDGRIDLLEKDGWWQQTEMEGELFRFHEFKFAESGGSQMFAYDFDADGDNDIVSVQNAHGWGLCWFERRGGGKDDFLFVKHPILGSLPNENPYGLAISQMHALALADIDGDGIKDIVTGKRFYAHGGADPGAAELPVLYWLRTTRTNSGIEFVPMLIDQRVGVGTQLTTGDVDGNGKIDIVVGNKLGTFVALNRGGKDPTPQLSDQPRHIVGTAEFKNGVRTTAPLTPGQERETFVLPPGFEAQLVAAEPDIAKPMNMAFDSRGRLWVSSSVEYPFPAPPDREGRDTIKILEDTDGDGLADKFTTFADKLNIPIGLYPYGDGVICYSIPNIWYLRDTNGDGNADQREILYGPFDYSRDTHGMCNAFTRGYDGWLYACHGFNNQSSVAGRDGNRVTMHSGNTFRMRLDGSRIEHFTHGQVNPFGMAFDARGDLFTADCHTKPIMWLLRGGAYSSFSKPDDGLGFVPDVMEHLHGSTAIAGLAIYEDDRFPEVFRGNVFGGNVMTSRVNRNSIHRVGGSIRAQEESDFLISGDPWFRPVDLQLGPDGALYIADFYNRIIGHYEVPLKHPGRDRHRGRIWRIAYNPSASRRDPAPTKMINDKTTGPDLESVLDQIGSANLTTRMLATNQITDEFTGEFTGGTLKRLQRAAANESPLHERIHARWALLRLSALTPELLQQAAADRDPIARYHGYQMVAAMTFVADVTQALIQQGFNDGDARVRRAAVMASIEHPASEHIDPLFNMLAAAGGDVHARHALRMSLVKHLSNREWFVTASQSADQGRIKQLLPLTLALKTNFAGEFLAKHLLLLSEVDQTKLTSYLSFAARYARLERVDSMVKMIEGRFAEDLGLQEQLARSISGGLQQRGAPLPPVIREWVSRIARSYLGMKPGQQELPKSGEALSWSYLPHPAAPDKGNPWTVSRKRSSADGQQSSILHSSFPKGETMAGIYRSERFLLPAEFSFYMAGHDGYPQNSIGHKNAIRLRDAKTHEVLKSWSPPRNDTAQHFTWRTGDRAGQQAYVELVDGDTATAFAWLAVGRFSLSGLNPSQSGQQRQKAAGLIEEFRLRDLKEIAAGVVADPHSRSQDLTAFARALVALDPNSRRAALAESLSIVGVEGELDRSLRTALLLNESEDALEILGKAMKVATAAEQQRVAEKLVSDQAGLTILVALTEKGSASPRLMMEPTMAAKITGIATEQQKQTIARLVKDLPSEDQRVSKLAGQRKASYLSHAGDASAGAEIFRVQCGICHQVAGKGAAVGPNLDGIGNRGLDRVVEDVMLPNRNIDAAFRASMVLTDDGQVISGLVKRTEGEQLVIVDAKGKEVKVPTDTIADRKLLPTSPMPANLHEVLDEKKTRDLLAYLLSLTH